MITVKEKYYQKEFVVYKSSSISFTKYGQQQRKRTTHYLFHFIPIFIKDEVISGDYERIN